jgi:hypothetical protein
MPIDPRRPALTEAGGWVRRLVVHGMERALD